jgi:hypothetical protein
VGCVPEFMGFGWLCLSIHSNPSCRSEWAGRWSDVFWMVRAEFASLWSDGTGHLESSTYVELRKLHCSNVTVVLLLIA